MKRNEIDKKFQWDFTHIFESKEEWEKAMVLAEEAINAVAPLAGTLASSKEAFKRVLEACVNAERAVELPYTYASLHKSADGSNPEYQEMNARGTSLIVKLSSTLSFLSPEILSVPEDNLKEWMADEDMAIYRHMIDDITRSRSHTLDAEREKMLAMLGDAARTPNDAYNTFTNVNLTLPLVHDDEGKEIQLTKGNFSVFRESRSRKVREEAFTAMFGTYKKYEDTFASLYSGSVKLDSYFATMRNYASSCEASLDSGNIPTSVYDSLITAVHNKLPAMRKYLELRKKALGNDDIDVFDLYTPMVEDVDYPMPFENVHGLLREALAPLGEDYLKLIDKAFAENWMDVYENEGKRSGAFSCGVYGVHPYVLLNYTDTLDDAFTVAHELGHAMHSYLSNKAQDYVNHSYTITVAEVASTVNEMLLTMYLLKTEKDTKRRAYVLNLFLEGFRTTLFRQTLFAEFERRAHELYENGQPLTAKVLNGLYHELEALYYDGAKINELIDIEWAYIPHFYRAFYVYQYATGFSSAVAIAKNILETGDASGYLKFLTTGGSDYPLNELKIAGIDLTDPKTVENALEVFSDTIDELSEIIG